MTSKLVPGNPSEVMVIRDVTPNIVTLSVPFLRFGLLRIGGRGTIGKSPLLLAPISQRLSFILHQDSYNIF
jgi:hypothetical protein